MQRRTPTRKREYRDSDLLTPTQAAEALGYDDEYFQNLAMPSSPRYEPDLRRMRVRTDETFRKAFRTKAMYVFPYGELVKWFSTYQSSPSMRKYNASRGIIVE